MSEKYALIQGTQEEVRSGEFQKRIEFLLVSGWKLQGGIAVDYNRGYVQAMTRQSATP
jgi:hypothetical protein